MRRPPYQSLLRQHSCLAALPQYYWTKMFETTLAFFFFCRYFDSAFVNGRLNRAAHQGSCLVDPPSTIWLPTTREFSRLSLPSLALPPTLYICCTRGCCRRLASVVYKDCAEPFPADILSTCACGFVGRRWQWNRKNVGRIQLAASSVADISGISVVLTQLASTIPPE
jgi:hypothetical protein